MTGWWTAAFVAQWVLLMVLTVIVVALARQVGTLHLRLGPRGALELDTEGPQIGEAPPPLTARDAEGAGVQIGGPGARRLVLFSSATCSVCGEVAPGVPVAASAAAMASTVVHDEQAEKAWDVPGTPFLVVLDEMGVVRAKGTVNNLEQVEGLIDTAAERVWRDSGVAWAS